MYFRHVEEIWKDFPQLVPGLLVAAGIDPHRPADSAIERWYGKAREKLAGRSESEMPEIIAWRRVYSQMGLKPTKYRSAAEALLRRFKREGDLPRLHSLVDLCNALSLAFALPVAVFDVEKIDRFLEVRRAIGRERYLAFSGEEEHPYSGEVIFADASERVHARRWTFRQSLLSTVSPETARVLIVCEGMHEKAERDVRSLIEELAAEISSCWQAPEHLTMLSESSPRLDF